MKSVPITAFAVVALLNAAAGTASAEPIVPVDWTTPTSGTIAGVNVSMTGLSSPF